MHLEQLIVWLEFGTFYTIFTKLREKRKIFKQFLGSQTEESLSVSSSVYQS